MTTQKHVRATKLLVLAGIILSCASFPMEHLGFDQLYPFFHWHLFAEPAGWDGARIYRLYWQDQAGAWHRRSPAARPNYTKKDQSYLLKSLVKATTRDTPHTARERHRLRTFAREIVPRAQAYRVVAETFQPLMLLQDTTRYDTTTVVHLE